MTAEEKLAFLIDKRVNIQLFIELVEMYEIEAYNRYNNLVGYWATINQEDYDKLIEILNLGQYSNYE